MPDRIWKQEISADAVLVSNGYNMRYLSGFRGTDGYLLLMPRSEEHTSELQSH